MAFLDCIQGKVNRGLLTKGQLDKLSNQYNGLLERYKTTMGDEQAASQAAARVVNVESERLVQKKRNEINAALAQERITKELAELESGGIGYGVAVRDLLERAHIRHQTVMKQHLSSLDEFAEAFRSKFAGLYRRSDGMKRVVQEMLGKSTGDAEARQFATSLRKVFDQAHARYRAAGGIIGKLDNYFPQVHKRELLKKVTFDEWYTFIRPRLDIDRMIDFDTGLPFREERLIQLARDDYQTIVTQGKSDLQRRAAEGKQTFGFGAEVSQRKDSSRFYHFKDADSFLEYNERFGIGESGLFDATINSIESISRDTGILEILGPKPNALMRNLDLQMTARDIPITSQKFVRGMYDVLTGYTDSSVGDPWWFRVVAGTRNIFSAAYLGSAPISALADTAFTAATAKFANLSVTRTLGRYLRSLNPLSSTDRKIAKKAGYIADIARGSALGDVRFTGENMGGKASAWLAQFTNRASGLHAMTKAAADAVSLEFESVLADLADNGVRWGSLNKEFRDVLSDHGLTERDWNIIRQADRVEPENGIRFLRSQEVSLVKGVDRLEALTAANKMDDLIFNLRHMANNEPLLRTRAITSGAFLGDARRGTILRMFAAMFFQFKAFSVTVMFNHLIPSFKGVSPVFRGNFKDAKFQRAGLALIGSSVMGAFALQMEQIVKGKDPRDMTDWRFWGAGMLKGGGSGIYGDFLFKDYTRSGNTFLETAGGAALGFASDFLRVLAGNLQRSLDDKTGNTWDKFKRDLFLLAKRNTPGNNLWYSRLVLERQLFDNLERFLDPKFDQRVRRIERKMLKDTGQQFFWRKGQALPRRAPEIAERR